MDIPTVESIKAQALASSTPVTVEYGHSIINCSRDPATGKFSWVVNGNPVEEEWVQRVGTKPKKQMEKRRTRHASAVKRTMLIVVRRLGLLCYLMP